MLMLIPRLQRHWRLTLHLALQLRLLWALHVRSWCSRRLYLQHCALMHLLLLQLDRQTQQWQQRR